MLAHKLIEKYLSDNNVDYFAYERYGVNERNPYHLINISLNDGTDVLFKISFNYNSTDINDEMRYRLSIYNDLSGKTMKTYSNSNLCYEDILRKVMRYKDKFKVIGGNKIIKESGVICICDSDIKSMVSECVMRLLTEDQTAKSISAAINLFMEKNPRTTRERAERFVRIDIRNMCPILRTDAGSKFILGVTRLYLEDWLWKSESCIRLNRALKIILSGNHINEFDRNLNNLSLPSLLYTLKDETRASIDAERNELASTSFDGSSHYTIVKINSFNAARKYGKYTDWCITHDADMFDSYTNYGYCQFYFCLADGFQNVQRVAGKNAPLDEYGLSMIAVCVDGEGLLSSSTCRWNHENGGSENVLSVMDISNLIGKNFYSVFKPNNNWKSRINTIKKVLKSGESFDPGDIFDDIGYENYGYTRVTVGDKRNYLSEDNKLMFDEWFDYAEDFTNNGYAKVGTYYGYNLIDKDCNFVFNDWYDSVYDYQYKDIFKVEKNGKYAIISSNGVQLTKWYDFIDAFGQHGVTRVYEKGVGWNIVKIDGKIALDDWYDGINGESYFGIYLAKKGDKYNFIDVNTGKPRFKTWFTHANPFRYGSSRTFVGYFDKNTGEEVETYMDAEGNTYGDSVFSDKIIDKIE